VNIQLIRCVVGLAAVLLPADVPAQEGQVFFANSPTRAVIDGSTGLPVAIGVANAGLYYTTDLTALPDLSSPTDAFNHAATTPIGRSTFFPGIYNGGTITLPGVDIAQPVLLQVRAWSGQQYDTFEDARNGSSFFGASRVMLVTTGGGIMPIPNTSTMVNSFTIAAPVPEPSMLLLGLCAGLGVWVSKRRRRQETVRT